MDINIPPSLQWVSYLAGSTWPQGSESGMFRIDEFFKAAAEELLNLEPDLYRVREETISVLFGDTAQVTDEQFALLFDGDYSVAKLADAVRALGDGAGNTGSEIQYTKWSVIIGLIIAAGEILYSLAMSGPTWGASLSWIPVTEATTTMTFRQLVSMVMRRILAVGRQLLGRTMVSRELRHQLRHEILQEAAEELGQQALQEGIVAGIQGDHYRLNTQRLVLNGVASTVGGGAGGGTAVPTSHMLGPASSKLGKAAKGVTTLFTAGVAGNMAGAASVGSNPFTDPMMVLASSTTSSVGGVRGAGVQAGHGGNNSNSRFTHVPGTGPRPPGPSIDFGGDFAPRGSDGAAMPTRGPVPDTIGKVNTGFTPRGGDGAAVPTSRPVPDTTTRHVNPVAAHQNPSQSSATPTTDHQFAATDESQTGPTTPHSDTHNASTSSSHQVPGFSDVHTDHGAGHDPTPDTHVADTPDPVTENRPTPAHHNPADAGLPPSPDTPTESKVEAASHQTNTVSADSPPVSPVPSHTPAGPATSATGASHSLTPSALTPTSARPPTVTPMPQQAGAVGPGTVAPKQNAPEHVSARPTESGSRAADAPAARVSDATAARVQPRADDAGAKRSKPVVDDRSSQAPGDPVEPTAGGPVHTANCGVGALDYLSGWHGQEYGLDVPVTAEGVQARAVYRAVNSRAEFTTFADAVKRLLNPKVKSGSSGLLTWSWAGDGGRHGGHTAVLVKYGNDVFLYDPHTKQYYQYDRTTRQFIGYWGQDAISQMAVGYLDHNGVAVKALDGTPNELAAADQIGHVQGHPDSDLVSAAFDQRVPVVPTHERIDDVVHDLASAELAEARARANVAWMARLTAGGPAHARTLIDALIGAHPFEMGNAWGVPQEVSDKAIREWLDRKHARADELRAKRRRTPGQQQFVDEVDRIEACVREVDEAAARAGLPPPRLLALDPTAFRGPLELRGNGRVLVAFGDSPYLAERVSWHIGRDGIDQLGETLIAPALDRLQLDQQETGSASAIVWVGKGNAARHAFYTDHAAFRAAREALVETGQAAPLTEQDVYSLRPPSLAEQAAAASLLTNPLRVDDGPRVIAHRGGPEDRPEQTLAAYEEAWRQGADAFEGDAQLTGDEVLVLLHNPSVNSQSDGTGFVHKMTLEELRQLDFGVNHPSRALGDAQGDTRIMTVEQLVQFVNDHPDRPLTAVIETKHWRPSRNYFELERRLVNLLQRHGVANPAPGEQARAVILSFYPESLIVIHRLAPDVPIVYHAPPLKNAGWAAVVASHHLAKALGAQGVDHYFETLRAYPEAVDHARRQGLVVWARTKNERDAQYARDLGVAWMGTDHPAQTVQWLGRGPADSGTTRLPPVLPAKEFVHPIGKPQDAVARVRRNVDWLRGLTEGLSEQQTRTLIDALIQTHPYRIGNADGFLPADHNTANREYVRRVEARARYMLYGDDRVSGSAPKHAERAVRIGRTLRQVDLNAEMHGLDEEPLLLAFDHHQFGGDGRAVLSFGDDPYHADEVVWLIARQPVDSLGHLVAPAAEQLQQMRAAHDGKRVAVIVWVGNTTLPVRDSHNAFFSDLAAFRAVREAMAETGDATPLAGNQVRALDLRATTEQTAPDLWLHPDADTLVFGHRGTKDLLPENSLSAFKLALRQGANALECDIQLSRDGQVVVVHDPFVNRATEGSGLVSRLTAAQLQELGIPTLAQLLDLAMDHDGPVTLFIETKHYTYGPKDIKLESKLVDLLKTAKYRHLLNPGQADQTRVAVHSMNPFDLRRLSRLAPNLPTVLLAPHLHTLQQVKAYIWAANKAGAKAISFFKTLRAFPEAVDLAHSHGLNVWAGVVHNATEAQYLLDLGVDIIGSNNPAPTLDWLGLGPTEPTISIGTERESRANLGRTAPGHPDAQHREGHRTAEGHGTDDAADGRFRRLWNTITGSIPNCGKDLIDYLSSLYESHGRHFTLGVEPSRKGVPARSVYEAINSRAHFVESYQDVADWLLQPEVPDGSSAMVASRWRGWRSGGHVYLALKIDGKVYLYDPHTKQLSDWPPRWGERAVGRIAVGYLNNVGIAVHPLDGTPGELAAADQVGHVKGPQPGHRGSPRGDQADSHDVDVPLRLDADTTSTSKQAPAAADGAGMRPDVTTTTEPASLQLSYGGDDSLFELLPGNEIQLGSSAESDLVAASESVSPEHATIGVARDGLLWIRDDSSDNGTWVNGDRLPPTHEFLLRDGDVIRFGDDELTVRCTQPGPPPVTVRLSSDGDVAPMRLTPGSETMLGRVEDSLLATVFGELEGVSSNHASMGVTWDGQVFIRDNGSRNGTWVNGDRITPGLKVPLYSGDTLRVGDVESTVTTEPEPAELIWFVSLPDQTRIFKIVVQPGSEVSLGSEASSPLPRLIAELPEVALNHATFGVTPEGRAWIRDNGSPEGIQVDDNRIPPGERVDLSDSARVALGDNGPGFNLRTHLSSERPPARVLLVRGDDEVGLDIPAGTELKLGSDPDSPLAGENGIRPDHARIGVHPEGYVWIRAIGSGATTFVNGVPLADTEPVRLYKSDVVGLGFHEDYAFTSMFGVKVVVFGEGPRLESEPHPVALRMPGLETAEPLRIDPGSHVQMGRAETSPLHELVNGDDSVADNHASIGVHPSGRVWIRDNESTTGTWVRDDRIEEGRKVALRPGDRIRIGQFETTVEFTQPALPDVIHLVDRSQATKQAVEDIALIPPAVYDRIMEHLEASRIGGVTLGNRALADLPGVDGMGPFEDTWTGLYLSAFRRLLVNTGAPDDGNPTVLHEFGHAADDAYGDGIHWLSSTPEFAAVHKAVHQVRRGRGVNQLRRHHRQRNKHYDTPVELFAEGFSAWLQGDEALLAFAYDDAGAAAKLKDYYDRVFGPLE